MSYQFNLLIIVLSYTLSSICEGLTATNAKFPHSYPLKLESGARCIYGNQCKSKNCSPVYKICMDAGATEIELVKIKNTDARNLYSKGGVCKEAMTKDNIYACVTAADGEPLDDWNPEKCGCDKLFLDGYKDGSWICGIPMTSDAENPISQDDKVNAVSKLEADKLISKVTGSKQRLLDSYLAKLKKIKELLDSKFKRSAPPMYNFNKFDKLAKELKNFKKAEETSKPAATTNTAPANTTPADSGAATTTANNGGKPAAPAKTKEELEAEEKAKKQAEEQKAREEAEKKKIEEQNKKIADFKSAADELIKTIGGELDVVITANASSFSAILAEVDSDASLMRRRSVKRAVYNDLNEVKIALKAVLSNSNLKMSKFRFKSTKSTFKTEPTAEEKAAAEKAAKEAEEAKKKAEEAAEKAKKEAEEAAEKAKKEAEEAAKKKKEEEEKAHKEKQEAYKKELDTSLETYEKALKEKAEKDAKAKEEAEKAEEEKEKKQEEANKKDVVNEKKISAETEKLKALREIMDAKEYSTYMENLYSLGSKILKRKMQEQAVETIRDMVYKIFEDPLIKTNKRSMLKRGHIEYAINKMTEEVYIMESRIKKCISVLSDIRGLLSELTE